jgi:hypothetical protein
MISDDGISLATKGRIAAYTHFLEIASLEATADQLVFTARTGGKFTLLSEFSDEILYEIRRVNAIIFPGQPLFELNTTEKLESVDIDPVPCGGFPNTYRVICKFLGMRPREGRYFFL